ncbi:unnamed protein product [Caenorhabditis angaria]|uniref:GH18 domain-containing protein n=1 Tax=Caenorhabditis angaria TaxID=860376 RepID=A0A9P1N2P7_9PELO|nr:unnamed protein product [Caenorhabditis angaria]
MILRNSLIFSCFFLSISTLLQYSTGKSERSLYCFVNTPDRQIFDPNVLSNVSCTHFVYGFVPINNPKGKPEFNNYDLMYNGRDGNIRKFLRLRSKHRDAKFLLGVERTASFRDVIDAQNVAKGMQKAYKEKQFDGVYVKFNGYHLSQLSSVVFMETLETSTMKPSIGVTAERVWQNDVINRLREIAEHVEHIYLDMSTVPSNEDPMIVTQVDVVFANGSIPYEDTIQGNVDKLAEEGIMPHKLIIGLSASGWVFKVPSVLKINHGMYADEIGRRISYQNACKARGAVLFDNKTLNEITIRGQDWTCANLPSENALGMKIEWILDNNFAGVGFNSIFEDDPKGECGNDPLPSHVLAMQTILGTLPSGPAKCTRLCYISPEEIDDNFPFDSLKSEFCSHIIVDYLELGDSIQFGVGELTTKRKGVEELLKKLNTWRRKIGEKNSPSLILSVGSNQKSSVWKFVVGNDALRKLLVDNIMKYVDEEIADGVEISWTKESMIDVFDKKNLMSLIEEINSKQEKDNLIEIMVAASAESTFANFYDIAQLNRTVDLVVLQTHKLHSNKIPFTGHPSPLRATPSMQNQKMSIEEMVKHWTSQGMSRKRLAISISASAISMSYISPDQKSISKSPFGQVASVFRSDSDDIKTQQEICESLQMETSESNWVETADVPVILRKNQLIAYENLRSAQVKAVWASIEGIGMAIHNLPADDPFGICDNRTAFPILTQLTRTQTCSKCIKQHDFRKCQHDFTVSCSFDLKSSKPIFKTSIVPYERCTEIVVEQLKLNSTGKIVFADKNQENVAKNLTTLHSKMEKCGLIMSLSCGSNERDFTRLLVDKMNSTIDNILQKMREYKFSGILLDCEKVVKRTNHRQFNTFLKTLQEKLDSQKAANNCSNTISIRFSDKTSSPNSLYQISQLNKLSHVALSNIDAKRVDQQFLGSHAKSTEQVLSRWLVSGVKPSKIVLEISPFAIKQSKNGTVSTLTQGQVCESVGNRAVFDEDFLDLVSTVGHDAGIISSPTVATFKYKIGFAVREELAGIGIRSVNGDDFTGICGRGSFPILKSVYRKDKC